MTARELSRSIRCTKLLQPSPISETRRPDRPRLRKFMIAPYQIAERSHACGRETIGRAMLEVSATYAHSPTVPHSATRFEPAGSVPEEQETTVVLPTRGTEECSIRSARPRG